MGFARTYSALFAALLGVTCIHAAGAAADPWPTGGVRVMAGDAMRLLRGTSGQIRVIAASDRCTQQPPATTVNAGLVEGVVSAGGRVLQGNGTEVLRVCERFEQTSAGPYSEWNTAVVGDSSGSLFDLVHLGYGFSTCEHVGYVVGPGLARTQVDHGSSMYAAIAGPDSGVVYVLGAYDQGGCSPSGYGSLTLQSFGPGGVAAPAVLVADVPVYTQAGLSTDGRGRAFVAWSAEIGMSWGGDSTHVQLFDRFGAPQWTADALLPHGLQGIVSDGEGGLYVLVASALPIGVGAPDSLRAVRLAANGQRYPGWPVDGVALFPPDGHTEAAWGDHGALMYVKEEAETGTYRLIRVLPSGSVAAGWGGGVPVSPTIPSAGLFASDGRGGMYAVWTVPVADPNDPNDYDLDWTHVFSDGSVADPSLSTLIGDGQGHKWAGDVTGDGGDGLYVAWTSTRTGSDSAYVSRLLDERRSSRLRLVSDVAPGLIGRPVHCEAHVDAGATGRIAFSIDGVPLDTVAVVAGEAAMTFVPVLAGAQQVTAAYSGDSAYAPTHVSIQQQTLIRYSVQMEMHSSAATVTPGVDDTLTAMVTPSSAVGTVTFLDGTNVLGTASLSNGSAQWIWHVPGTTMGALAAIYSGDSTHVSSDASLSLEVHRLSQALGFIRPNPSRGAIEVAYDLPTAAPVDIAV